MKRILAALLCAGTAACMSGCAQQAPQTEQHTGTRIALSMSSRDQFLVTVEASALQQAGERKVDCTVWDAGNDYAVQMQHVKDAKEQGYDALIVNEVSPSLTRGILREAGDMPVVFVNRQPEMDVLTAGQQVYVGSDDSEPGRFQAAWLNDYAEENGLDHLDIVYLTGTEGQSSTAARRDSLTEHLSMDYDFVYDSTAQFDRAKAKVQMETLIQAGRTFDAVVAQNDEMAIGAAQAIQAAGMDLCPILGIDGTAAGCQAVLDGQLAFTVRQSGDEQGRVAVDAALALIAGDSLDTVSEVTMSEDGLSLMIPYTPVDADNAAEYLA